MCQWCDMLGQWICCGGIISKGERCPGCGLTQREAERDDDLSGQSLSGSAVDDRLEAEAEA